MLISCEKDYARVEWIRLIYIIVRASVNICSFLFLLFHLGYQDFNVFLNLVLFVLGADFLIWVRPLLDDQNFAKRSNCLMYLHFCNGVNWYLVCCSFSYIMTTFLLSIYSCQKILNFSYGAVKYFIWSHSNGIPKFNHGWLAFLIYCFDEL